MTSEPDMRDPSDIPAPLLPGLAAGLAALRADHVPPRELWPEIAARIAEPAAHEPIEWPAPIAAELAALRRDAPPPVALWTAIARRLEAADERDHAALPTPLREALLQPPRDMAPARDLWPAIAARTVARPLIARPRRGPLAGFAIAASLLVAVALVVQTGRPLDGMTGDALPTRHAQPRPSAAAQVAAVDAPRRASSELLRVRYRPISADARALMQGNLAIVDGAVAQIERAMNEDPDSADELRALLDSARAQRAQLRAALGITP